MKKELIRKEFFKLKLKGHSYNQCRKILKAKYDYEVHNRTLQRWMYNLDYDDKWDLKDKSKRPKIIFHKITPEIERKIISVRKQTGWGERKIENLGFGISHKSINKILTKHKLTEPQKRKKKRNKYVRFERKHPNSLWQIDHSDQKIDDKWVVSVIDDCSRKNLTFIPVNRVTTNVVTKILDDLIKIYGKPREILSDNGSAYGLRSKHSKFDRWCRKRGILHIRSAVHSPTTCGKIERLFQTFKREIKFCNNDPELFRMRYNHFRPHTSLNKKTPDEVYDDFSLLF
ncbi:DDE-type integrase/transposase/recombinase [Nanoarchaeota archaeon]